MNILNNNLSGLIILDKPKGITSNDCLNKLKKMLNIKKIGHTGTLDKNATGVLICLLGDATKSQEYLMNVGDKTYEAEIILGISTDTEDIWGDITDYVLDINAVFHYDVIDDDFKLNFTDNSELYEESYDIDKDEIIGAIKSFEGTYEQIPPMISSKKLNGKKYMEYAKQDIEIDRKPVKVDIKRIDIKDFYSLYFEEDDTLCYVKIKIIVKCSKGTYIRTLCKDIGEELDLPSCMGNLRRIENAGFNIKNAITLKEIENKIKINDFSFIKPCFYMERDAVITFGKFETLHIGHKKIIEQVVKYAKNLNYESTVLRVCTDDTDNILTKDQRISKLKYMGVDNKIDFQLNEQNKNLSAEYFVEEILIKQLKAKIIVVGSDCRFGKDAIGNSEMLKNICNKYGIEVKIIQKVKIPNTDTDVSSTYIKKQIENGNQDLVKELFG